MIYDLHVHTHLSSDSSVKPEDYLAWINCTQRDQIGMAGLVFVEHYENNKYSGQPADDYRLLEERFGLKIFRGLELDTDCGHLLYYGLTSRLGNLKMENGKFLAREVIEKTDKLYSIAVPAHPGRKFTGLVSYMNKLDELTPFRVIEQLNGGSTMEENKWATTLALQKGFRGIGGSDAHYVTQVGKCLTRFTVPLKNEEDFIYHLHCGNYDAFCIDT
ncbi:MAG: PHP domain-containing protein [Candidatus Tectomicrobia bacterium]|uniref:PHP domain-containing protein n=1 Tax=Tectimicrobiota bacterium TaxID=2528274 RepID=A0A933LQ10_UNCTE|nr:PHP domain-containing protein [Candidatus Tectomicrobia bacterium]